MHCIEIQVRRGPRVFCRLVGGDLGIHSNAPPLAIANAWPSTTNQSAQLHNMIYTQLKSEPSLASAVIQASPAELRDEEVHNEL
jgi:hypothetical protein